MHPVRQPQTSRAADTLRLTPAELVADAINGVRRRGAQDLMLQVEAQLPGFGGFFIDETGEVVVLMKPSRASIADIRSILTSKYAAHPNPRVRAIMGAATRARVVEATYSLSELIAFENQVPRAGVPIQGFRGLGVSIVKNRVVLGLSSETDAILALAALESAGIPRVAIMPEVWGEISLNVVSFSASWPRPAGGGMRIGINVMPDTQLFSSGSLGFSARASDANTYFMLTTHQVNMARAANGVTGDTVWQPERAPTFTGLNLSYGRIALNHPWTTNPAICGTDPRPGPNYGQPIPFCTDMDVALATYLPAAGGPSFKVGTSTYEGINGASGTDEVRGWWPLSGTLEPEYVMQHRNIVHKSGAKTGTTTGEIDLPSVSYYVEVYWPPVRPPGIPVTKTLWITGQARVKHAGWGSGDSGGVVFAREVAGGPYFALGIESSGEPGGQVDSQGKCNAGVQCAFYFTPWSTVEARYNMVYLSPTP